MNDFRDDPAIVEVFWQETEEQLLRLEQGLVAIEQDGHSATALNDVFRAAHTLKGSCGMMGYSDIAELTHAMEELLDALRQGKREVDEDVVNALLAGNDCLRSMFDAVRAKLSTPSASTAILKLKQASAVAQSEGTIDPAVAKASGVDMPPLADGAVRIQVTISADCMTPTIRAFMVFNALRDKSEVICSNPDEADTESVFAGQSILLDVVPHNSDISVLLHALSFSEITVTILDDRREQPIQDSNTEPAECTATPNADDVVEQSEAKPSVDMKHFAGLQTVRVAVERLDALMNLVGELVVGRSRIDQLVDELTLTIGDSNIINDIKDTSQSLGQFTADLQEQIMRIRMLPVEQVFNRFPRMVRDISHHAGKRVKFIIQGQNTELDRSLMEDIVDPITQLLRNAIDHGVEPPEERISKGKNAEATVTLSARHEENHIVISVSDDGRGISTEQVRRAAVVKGAISQEAADRMSEHEVMSLIFLPAVSTAAIVTEISGRGVGMDVVKNNIERLGGSVEVESPAGHGTTITIRLPLTLAIVNALIVQAGNNSFAIPLSAVVETSRCDTSIMTTIEGRSVLPYRGSVLPVVKLSDLLHIKELDLVRPHSLLVVVKTAGQHLGLLVDGLLGSHEVVIKPLGSFFNSLKSVSGATLLGDGRIALVLDTGMLPQLMEEWIQHRNDDGCQ